MKYERWLIPETDPSAVDALMDAGLPFPPGRGEYGSFTLHLVRE